MITTKRQAKSAIAKLEATGKHSDVVESIRINNALQHAETWKQEKQLAARRRAAGDHVGAAQHEKTAGEYWASRMGELARTLAKSDD